MNFTLLIFFISSIAINYFFTGWFLGYAKVRRITDIPTERSSHVVPTPRGGGVGFVIVSLCALVLYVVIERFEITMEFWVFILSASAVACLGWVDDKKDLSKRIRFSIQLIASASVIFLISSLDWISLPLLPDFYIGIFGAFLGLIWITGTTNIFNFMDGVDGIACMQAISAALGWSVFAYLWDDAVLFSINILIIAALLGFLMYNWSPARIFMGDVGSVYLGFLFGIMPFLAAGLSDAVSIGTAIWIGGLLLWPFLFDGAFTIFRRLYNRENIFEAHRSHLYQRLNIIGWSHSKISLLYLSFSLIAVVVSLLFTLGSEGMSLFVFLLLVLSSILFSVYVHRLEHTVSREKG